jgi:hypothetical protein
VLFRSQTNKKDGQKRPGSDPAWPTDSNSGTVNSNDVHALSSEAGPSNTSNIKNTAKHVSCRYEGGPEGACTIVMNVGKNYIKFPLSEVDGVVATLVKYAEWNGPKKSKIVECN